MQGRRERAGFVTEASLTNWSSKRPSSPMVPQNMQVTTEVSSMKQAVRQYWRSGSSTRPSSSMVLQWFVNKWWRQQKFVNNPESSSILTNWFVNSSSMCKTCSSILTDFLAIDELSGSLTQFCGRQQLLTNHWRTWLRLWARSSILTNCLFHWRTSVVSRIFWGTMGELSNLGAYQFVNDWEIKWQTLLTTLGDRSMKQTGLLEFLTAASGFQAEMFLHFFCAPWFFDHVAFKFEKKISDL